jgi:hypothetical protein
MRAADIDYTQLWVCDKCGTHNHNELPKCLCGFKGDCKSLPHDVHEKTNELNRRLKAYYYG